MFNNGLPSGVKEVGNMPRTVKDPEERKAELLDTAMRLFAESSSSALRSSGSLTVLGMFPHLLQAEGYPIIEQWSI